ncbi:MAG: hypothetical protein K2K83_03275, partial [Rikenella sp.]|nr:hypothetical protein [Rikenella sp.]
AAAVSAIKDRNLSRTDGKATYVEVIGAVTKSATRPQKAIYRFLLGDPATNPGDFNVRRNNVYTLSVDIQGINTADSRVEVETFDMNNCAMVVPATGSVTFDVRKCLSNGFTSESQLNTMLSSGAWRVAVLWQDVALANYVTINYNLPGKADDKSLGIFSVKSNSGTAGNAVVALYNNATSGGTILWSWHVWITTYQPDGGQSYNLGINSKLDVTGGEVHTYGAQYQATVNAIAPTMSYSTSNTRVIMDRNLGATGALYSLTTTNAQNYPTYGLRYQWGRKDPFPKVKAGTAGGAVGLQSTYHADGTIADFPKFSDGPVTASGAIQAPGTFFKTDTEPMDWQIATSEAAWGHATPKSIYDPCPEGWRIPPIGVWDDFGSNGTAIFTSGTADGVYKNPAWVDANVDIGGFLYKAGSVKAFYPPTGEMYASREDVDYVGLNASVWTSYMSGNRAYNLLLSGSYVYSLYSLTRGTALAIRCIQE